MRSFISDLFIILFIVIGNNKLISFTLEDTRSNHVIYKVFIDFNKRMNTTCTRIDIWDGTKSASPTRLITIAILRKRQSHRVKAEIKHNKIHPENVPKFYLYYLLFLLLM